MAENGRFSVGDVVEATGDTHLPDDADGFLRAPSGGDGGAPIIVSVTGNGGNGGAGRDGGIGGNPGPVGEDMTSGSFGVDGLPTGVLGIDGLDNAASKGLRGKGVVDSGATVTFFGDTPARYINGGGDHP